MDVAISNGGDNTIEIYLGNGDGTFGLPELIYTVGSSPNSIATTALHKGGHLDLIVSDGDSNIVEVWNGKGDGTFTAGARVSVPEIPLFLLTGDFNKDGNADILVGLLVNFDTNEPQFQILLGDGTGALPGTITPPGYPSLPYPTITTWYSVGDVNRDGYPDVLTTVAGEETRLYRNKAGTEFGRLDPFSTYAPSFVSALGDMNEDGCPDIVTIDAGSYTEIAAGHCDWTFDTSNPIDFNGDYAYAMQLADVNNDGHLDIVGSGAHIVNSFVGYGLAAGYIVSVIPGDGRGGLDRPRLYSGSTDQYSLLVSDLNNDSYPEIVTTGQSLSEAVFLTNDGKGGYGVPDGLSIGDVTTYENNPIPFTNVVAADVNGDGKPDLFALEFGDASSYNMKLTTIPNLGDGQFGLPIRTPVTIGDISVGYNSPLYVLGNFHGSNCCDAVVLEGRNSEANALAFIPSKGDGTYGVPVALGSFNHPFLIAAGDFNGDKKLDFAVIDQSLTLGDDGICVFLGKGDGTFTQLAVQNVPNNGGNDGLPDHIVAGDFNHDGKVDLLLGYNANMGGTLTGDGIEVIPGNGDGTFGTPVVVSPHFGEFDVADVNHDGLLDLIEARNPAAVSDQYGFYPSGVTIWLGKADGTFAQQAPYDLPGIGVASMFAPKLALGDFNGDGNIDIAVRFHDPIDFGGRTTLSKIRILEGLGDGSFAVGNIPYQLQFLSAPFAGADFNGDGKTDLVDLSGFTSSLLTIPAAAGPALDIRFNQSPIVSNTLDGIVTLNYAHASAVDVALTSSDPAVSVPASVHFPAGTTSQPFNVSIAPTIDTTHATAVTARLGTDTAVAYTSVANPNAYVGLDIWTDTAPLGLPSVTPGETYTTTLYLQSVRGYHGDFSDLKCTGMPAGITCAFEVNTVHITPGGEQNIKMQVVTSSTTPFGTFTFPISTTDGHITATTNFSIGIGDFAVHVSPSSVRVSGSGGMGKAKLSVTATNGLWENVAISCTGLPTGASCYPISPLPPSGTIDLAVGVFGKPDAGDYTFNVVGTLNALTHSVPMTLHVQDYAVSVDKTTATISAGQTATFTLTLQSNNGYANTLSINCGETAGDLTVSCTPSASSVDLAANASSTVTLTITAPASASTSRASRSGSGATWWFAFAFAPLLILRRRDRKRFAWLFVGMMLISVIVSCGGGGSGGGTPPPPPPAKSHVLTFGGNVTSKVQDWDNGAAKPFGPIQVTVN